MAKEFAPVAVDVDKEREKVGQANRVSHTFYLNVTFAWQQWRGWVIAVP